MTLWGLDIFPERQPGASSQLFDWPRSAHLYDRSLTTNVALLLDKVYPYYCYLNYSSTSMDMGRCQWLRRLDRLPIQPSALHNNSDNSASLHRYSQLSVLATLIRRLSSDPVRQELVWRQVRYGTVW
jgi:hypothetical protein